MARLDICVYECDVCEGRLYTWIERSRANSIDFSEDWKVIMWWTSREYCDYSDFILSLCFFFIVFTRTLNKTHYQVVFDERKNIYRLLRTDSFSLSSIHVYTHNMQRSTGRRLCPNPNRKYVFFVVDFIVSDKNEIEIKFQTSIQILIFLWCHTAGWFCVRIIAFEWIRCIHIVQTDFFFEKLMTHMLACMVFVYSSHSSIYWCVRWRCAVHTIWKICNNYQFTYMWTALGIRIKWNFIYRLLLLVLARAKRKIKCNYLKVISCATFATGENAIKTSSTNLSTASPPFNRLKAASIMRSRSTYSRSNTFAFRILRELFTSMYSFDFCARCTAQVRIRHSLRSVNHSIL